MNRSITETVTQSVEVGYEATTEMPGCSDVIISHGVFIKPEFRHKGYGAKAHKERLARLTTEGYTAVLCTVRSDNEAQLKILSANGWEELWKFWTKEHNVPVYLYGKHLIQE